MYEELTDYKNILQERYIVCASWKELGDDTVHSVSTLDNRKLYKKEPHNDLHVVKTLCQVLSEADAVVAHNGIDYDWKFLQGRALIHGLGPMPPVKQVDTLKVARSQFLLNSNRLDYLGKMLKVGQKIDTKTGLWLKVLAGDQDAIRDMVTYNQQDVILLEKVFLKLKPYIPTYLNRQLFGSTGGCPECGSLHLQSRGYYYSETRSYRRFQCQDCLHWVKDSKAFQTTNKRGI